MSEKKEKEIVIDLSKKVKFSDNLYISIGSLILSILLLLLQGLTFGWSWGLLYHFVYSLKYGKLDEVPKEEEKR